MLLTVLAECPESWNMTDFESYLNTELFKREMHVDTMTFSCHFVRTGFLVLFQDFGYYSRLKLSPCKALI